MRRVWTAGPGFPARRRGSPPPVSEFWHCRRAAGGSLRAILRERIARAQAFLLARRCADGGWNHGAARSLGYNSDSYPETTGQALLALAGTDAAKLGDSFRLAQRFLREQRSSGGAAWLRLGLLAHQQVPAAAPIFCMPCRTLPDTALTLLAAAAEQGHNVFLE